jgi:hypothetical protein
MAVALPGSRVDEPVGGPGSTWRAALAGPTRRLTRRDGSARRNSTFHASPKTEKTTDNGIASERACRYYSKCASAEHESGDEERAWRE